ncbi:MAG: hypothetical protein O7150_06230 [Wolbachia endosymbiont of Andrena praecox]|uniref:hypothetical protein n=1 Tax=unclassified Wolbachia TaxID=2640676 RepID=UPI0007EED103|nr:MULTISPECIES: hypothetical protein [unclassified Wolbachia]MDX5488344.1 hypothetical protein [Wolbachia endosymbiont of Andrena praecox]MDX5496419.1 hypothetical protein [Wolbachia endosymbiont of Nomada fabriciana]MDX5526842.1 hypothetical protein [Wolbachia endosymbiont of Andrena nigroaenea]MDX5528104.1 hypothetical protein [Wolbachia endosymbiont of Andrena minutula]MDX5543412.1 hypothetical protein [Wolbachia endosymbiont of Andrena apicata]
MTHLYTSLFTCSYFSSSLWDFKQVLTEGSDVILTFYTSLGELKVRLCPHEENKNSIKVEVSKEGALLLKEIESYNKGIEDCEEIGQNCLL